MPKYRYHQVIAMINDCSAADPDVYHWWGSDPGVYHDWSSDPDIYHGWRSNPDSFHGGSLDLDTDNRFGFIS